MRKVSVQAIIGLELMGGVAGYCFAMPIANWAGELPVRMGPNVQTVIPVVAAGVALLLIHLGGGIGDAEG